MTTSTLQQKPWIWINFNYMKVTIVLFMIIFIVGRPCRYQPTYLMSTASVTSTATSSQAVPFLVENELSLLGERAHTRLSAGANGNTDENSPFRDVLISLPLHSELFHSSSVGSEGDKFFVAPLTLQQQGQNCIVYAAGLADDVKFENFMAGSIGCDVHGFDCTVMSSHFDWNFTFHDTCIGRRRDFEGSLYSKAKAETKLTFDFNSLDEIRANLGHDHIDILKMDIEGFEWDILDELLQLPDSDLPHQLLFELHTEGANPVFIPPSVVKGKTRKNVNELFEKLYNRGYRVVFKQINPWEPLCCDFTVIRIHNYSSQFGG